MLSSKTLWPTIILFLVLPFMLHAILLVIKKGDLLRGSSGSSLQRQVNYAKTGAWVTRIQYILLQTVMAVTFYTFPYSLFVKDVDQDALYTFNVVFHLAQAICIILYLLTSFMDPGYIASSSLVIDDKTGIKNEASPLIGTHYNFPFEPVMVSVSNPPISYCYECQTIPALRARHNYESGCCVAVFDHYDSWVGNAIGAKNHRYYIMLLFLEVFVFVTAFCLKFDILANIINDNETEFVDALGWFVIIFVLIYMFVVSVKTIPLFVFHLWIISKNKTTPEVMKPDINDDLVKFIQDIDLNGEYETDDGDFNRGLVQNWLQVMKGFKDKPQYFYALKCSGKLEENES